MRAFQFWVLLIASTIISGLLIKQIFLNRQIYFAQRSMVDNDQVAVESQRYEDLWKDLAVTVYNNSHQDPTLAAVLKDENVGISTMAPGTAPVAPSVTTNPTPNAASSKTSTLPPTPATTVRP